MGTPHLRALLDQGQVTLPVLATGVALEFVFALLVTLAAFATLFDPRGPKLGGFGVGLAQVAVIAFGFAFAPLFSSHDTVTTTLFLSLGLALMGCTYGALGTALAELFPTAVRYTGASLTFNLAGILGGSLAPYIATGLANSYGVAYVGYYLSAAAAVTLAAQLLLSRRDVKATSATQRSAA